MGKKTLTFLSEGMSPPLKKKKTNNVAKKYEKFRNVSYLEAREVDCSSKVSLLGSYGKLILGIMQPKGYC